MSLSVMKSKIAPLLARCVFVQSLIKDPLPWCHLLNVSQFSNFLMESNLISESGPLIRSLQSLLSCPLKTLQVAFQKPKDILDFLWFFGILSNFTPSTSLRMFSQVMLNRRTATVIYGMSYTFTYLVKAAPIAASVHFNLEISESFCPPWSDLSVQQAGPE